MTTDKISIIVPAYNIESYIEKTVKSICAQSYENLEIIIINDGSKDNTGKVLDELSKTDDRIKVIHKENGGVTSARLKGIESATGDWIGFVDGDDFIDEDMYERLIANAIKYDADISHCGYKMVFPSRIDYYYNTGKIVEQDNDAGLKDLLEGNFIEPGLWNKLYRRSLLNSFLNDKGMDTSIKINEDLLMNFYLFQLSQKSVFEDFCPYHYMLRKGSAATSKLNENKLSDPLKVKKILLEETKDDKNLNFIVKKAIVSLLISMATLSYGSQKELIKPHRKNARKELRKLLPEVITENFSSKQKIATLWVSIWPASYGWIHRLYARVTGLDKKYEVK